MKNSVIARLSGGGQPNHSVIPAKEEERSQQP